MLRARRAGSAAAEVLEKGGPCRVVTATERAVNLLFEDGLIGLLPEGTQIHPWAVTVRGSGRVRPGDEVEVDVSGAAVLELRLERRPENIPPDIHELLLGRVEPYLEDDWYESVLAGALARFVAGEPEALGSILGVGEGLTPSGDDIVVGVLAALDWAGAAWPGAAEVRAAVARTIQPGRTTKLAHQLLASAAAGAYAEVILDVLHALDGSGVRTAVDRLLAVGHRSGRDTVRGVGAGLALVAKAML